MKIGVVCPTYNQAKWLPEALASYHSQKTPPESELVVVNDGSTDETATVLSNHKPPLYVATHEKNRGTAEAINTGINAMVNWSCDALTWISSDNTMDSEWLAVLSRQMENSQAGVVYSGFTIKYPDRPGFYFFRKYHPTTLINDVNCFFGPSFLIRQEVWLEAGGHRGKISHDYDHWLRVEEVCMKRNLPIIGVDRPLCLYRAHPLRATVVRKHEFDAYVWQKEAKTRRAIS